MLFQFYSRSSYSLALEVRFKISYHSFQFYSRSSRVWIHRMVQLYDYVRRFVGDVWVVVPDYPSDYPNNPIPDNVELSIL